jgi:hypothetical protein
MGSTSYSSDVYTSRLADYASKGKDLFDHDADIRSGRTDMQVHDNLNPAKQNKLGKIVRESFDSDLHPNSRAVSVIFDVTGSMSFVPRVFVKKLDKLMGYLVKKGYLEHPQILFGSVGDAFSDKVPLQIGQFESGNEMDDVLSKIVLESGGGGTIQESYELAMYFLARHTDLDCLNKRGEKGFLFIFGDETPYSKVSKSQVKRLIGVDIQEDIPTESILEELREKFEVFWVMPAGTNHWDNSNVIKPMQKLFGQNFLKLENADDVVELIASTIAVSEGYDIHDVSAGLKDLGASDRAVKSASSALATYAGKPGLAIATVEGSLTVGGNDNIARL